MKRVLFALVLALLGLSAAAQGGLGNKSLTPDDKREADITGASPFFSDPATKTLEDDDFAARVTACPSSNNLICPYNTNNGQRGAMFDILATNTVTIRCFDVNLYSGTTANYYIYYRAGTHVGFENNSAAWTLLGSANAITSLGVNLPTPIPIPVNVVIPAGQRYSFYITNDFGGGTSYTDGTAVGNFLSGDANITTFEGVGKSYPFGLTFTVRVFNGTIYYDLGAIFDAGQASLEGLALGNANELNWKLEPGTTFAGASLEWSADGREFQSILQLPNGELEGQFSHAPGTAHSWYRIKMKDADGGDKFSKSIHLENAIGAELDILALYPNPAHNSATLAFQSGEASQVQVIDMLGKVVWEKEMPSTSQVVDLPLQDLPGGVYQVCLKNKTRSINRRLVKE